MDSGKKESMVKTHMLKERIAREALNLKKFSIQANFSANTEGKYSFNDLYQCRVTNYLAIDCEMDQLRSDFSFTGSGLNIPCKVSIINE